jgi:tripartite-type tricarboxylate transporter receptor subunit TctC
MRILRCLIIGLLFVATGASWSQGFPDKSRPIKIIVPFGAASSTDIMARALARGITEVSGMSAFVDNKAGAEGVIGVNAAKAATPDGYTILMGSSSTQAINPHMLANMGYDPVSDFIPVTGIGRASLMLNVGPTVHAKTPREFIAQVRHFPGKFTFGSGSTSTRLGGELLQRVANVKMLSVPYKSNAAALTALAAGEIDVVIVDYPSASAQYQSGRVRPLAWTGPVRMPVRADLPTMREEGFDLDVTAWWAIYLPAKAPAPVVSWMRETIAKAAKTKTVTDTLEQFSVEPFTLVGDEVTAFQERDSEHWAKVVNDAKIPKQ